MRRLAPSARYSGFSAVVIAIGACFAFFANGDPWLGALLAVGAVLCVYSAVQEFRRGNI